MVEKQRIKRKYKALKSVKLIREIKRKRGVVYIKICSRGENGESNKFF
ncbi:hypothetical protein J7J69_02815 [candidate division WOR-3 bacterium]|nr:hypothetical protein [candidate division WOR-3 bacterium]